MLSKSLAKLPSRKLRPPCLWAAIGKTDDDKPKAKEAETVKLPDFPNPETYRSWKTAVREAVRAASDTPEEAFQWVQRFYKRSATLESLGIQGSS